MYMGHYKWLRHKHPYRLPQFNDAFNGHPEEKGVSPIITNHEVEVRGMEIKHWIGEGG
jgi:hypothetical protein